MIGAPGVEGATVQRTFTVKLLYSVFRNFTLSSNELRNTEAISHHYFRFFLQYATRWKNEADFVTITEAAQPRKGIPYGFFASCIKGLNLSYNRRFTSCS